MYACNIATTISNKKIAMPIVNQPSPMTERAPRSPISFTKMKPLTSSRLSITWPATRLANNRTASVNGRSRNVEKNSMRPTRGRRPTGTDFGHTMSVK